MDEQVSGSTVPPQVRFRNAADVQGPRCTLDASSEGESTS